MGGQSEADVLKDCKALLIKLQTAGKLLFNRIHVGGIRMGGVGKLPNRDMVGMEDIQVCLPLGKTLRIELKDAKGKLTPQQEDRRDSLLWLGHGYYVIRSVEELGKLLIENGVG